MLLFYEFNHFCAMQLLNHVRFIYSRYILVYFPVIETARQVYQVHCKM